MTDTKLLESFHPLERKVWPFLKENITAKELGKLSKLKDVEVVRALQWLEAKGILKINTQGREIVSLASLGEEYSSKGLPEKRFLENLKGITPSSKIPLSHQELGVCIGLLKKNNAIKLVPGKELSFEITGQGKEMLEGKWQFESLAKKLPAPLGLLSREEKELFMQLKSRGIVASNLEKGISVSLTDLGKSLQDVKFSSKDIIDALTPKILAEGSWKGKDFRRYDINAIVPSVYPGKRHFVSQSLRYIKKIWLELGFTEMSGTMVNTAFWDLDSLFVPQDHPARAMQDTFYLKEPKFGKLPAALSKKVKAVHENGADTGSTGWQEPWSEDIAKRLLLRTHTTVLSAQAIAKLKQSDLPVKLFAVGKVYRNEAMDWKHLFEFEQVEGIVVDPNANFKHLKGYLTEFYQKMGFTKIRIRPSHFPYTEPSVEVDVYNPIKKQWVELGGAGIFRPEVSKTLLGFEVPILAWGQGMARIISEYYNIKDIRDMNCNDLRQIRNMKEWMQGCLQ